MKYWILALLFTAISALGQAQPARSGKERHEASPAQRAEIKTKQLALQLDLNSGQQKEVMALEMELSEKRDALKREFQKEKEAGKESPDMDRPAEGTPQRKPQLPSELRIKMLDLQLAHQEGMKKILNNEQYKQWKEMRHQKIRAHQKRSKEGHKGRKGS